MSAIERYYLGVIAAQGEEIGYLKERLAILERRMGLSMQIVQLDLNRKRR